MAFTDALVADSDATAVIVDRRHAPGGHWNDAYPFVRLHQPSAFYGVNSLRLGRDRIDEAGLNAGFYEQATAAEMCDYYRRVLEEQLLGSGQVAFLGSHEYVGEDNLDAGKGHIYIWDYEAQRVVQVFDAGDENATTEARWLRDPETRAGFTHTVTGGQLWLFEDLDADGTFDFHHVADTGAMVLDIAISYDDRWLYTSDYAGSVTQYDISDPFNPLPVAKVPIPFSGMMRLSLDGTRLYVTNSILSSLDDGPTEPRLSPFNKAYGLFMIDVDPQRGGMILSTEFFVDFNDVELGEDEDGQEIRGRAGPHMVMFDPSVDAPFGGHHEHRAWSVGSCGGKATPGAPRRSRGRGVTTAVPGTPPATRTATGPCSSASSRSARRLLDDAIVGRQEHTTSAASSVGRSPSSVAVLSKLVTPPLGTT